jgi:molybdopterin-synthase adenylyltransferase
MIELRLQDADVSRIVGELVGRETERCAILLASHVALSDELERLIVTRVEYPDDDSYSDRGSMSAELKPDYVAHIGKWQHAKIFPSFLCTPILGPHRRSFPG